MLLGGPSSDKEAGCLGVFAVEQAGPFLLAPGEGAGATVRFTPQDARWGERARRAAVVVLFTLADERQMPAEKLARARNTATSPPPKRPPNRNPQER